MNIIEILILILVILLLLCLFIMAIILLFGDKILVYLEKERRKKVEKRIKYHRIFNHETLREIKNLDTPCYLFLKDVLSVHLYQILFAYLTSIDKSLPSKYIDMRMDVSCFTHYTSFDWFRHPKEHQLEIIQHAFIKENDRYYSLLFFRMDEDEEPIKGFSWKKLSEMWNEFMKKAYTIEEIDVLRQELYDFNRKHSS